MELLTQELLNRRLATHDLHDDLLPMVRLRTTTVVVCRSHNDIAGNENMPKVSNALGIVRVLVSKHDEILC